MRFSNTQLLYLEGEERTDDTSSVSSFGERTLELLLAFNGFGLKDDAREKRGRRPFVGGDDW